MARHRPAASGTTEPAFDRAAMVERLATESFDVLVVGGGITGAGVALDAAARGYRTALVEAGDFASGTSSKSSKLVHGGLRYLQQGDVRLVYQALRERKRLRRNAPHLVKILPFLIPITTKDGVIPRRVARALGSAMWMYDLTGGWRIGKLHERLTADQAHSHLPTMPRERLAGGYLYYDATVDDARLVLTVARTAAAHGAAIANRCRVTAFLRDGDAVTGAIVDTGDSTIRVSATVVVNAAGVWADELHALETPPAAEAPTGTIRPAKGVHITVPWELVRNDIAAVIPVRGDKRSLFVVPWGLRADGTFEHTYIGTTDTDYAGPLDDPPCTAADITYVLDALNAAIAGEIRPDQVTGVWAGLRPLVAAAGSARTADLSRRHRVTTGPGGVVTISGGKLTTYREMAEDTVDHVTERLGDGGWRQRLRRLARRVRRSGTRSLPLLGAVGYVAPPAGTPAAHLADRYGSGASALEALVAAAPALGEPLVAGLPYLRAEAVYAVRSEMATTLTDVLTRRTRSHLLDRAAAIEAAPVVADLLAAELGWDGTERDRQLDAYRALVDRERADADTGVGAVEPTSPIELTGAAARWHGAVTVERAFLDDLALVTTVIEDDQQRAECSRDWWPLALHWALGGEVAAKAAAVCRPASAAEVAAIAELCHRHRVPLTATGGRSGVTGASVPAFGGIVVDLTSLAGVVDVDVESGIVDVWAGTFGPDLERQLAEYGLAVGHLPQSFELATVGGWIACRGAGQYSTRYGKIEDLVVGLEVVLADGRVLRTGGAPAAAAGPDLNQLFCGAEGTLGVITRAWLRAHPLPASERRAAYSFASFPDGIDACRTVLRLGATPAVLRLYDAVESAAAGRGGDGTSCTLLVLDEGDPRLVDATMDVVADACRLGERAPESLVDTWLEHRNDTSALQAVTRQGYVVDTMEVAAPWRRLGDLFHDVRAALLAVPHAIVATCHLSHSYGDGACLYFTFAAKPPASDIESTYTALWDAGQRAVLAHGGNLSHHHGVGINRARFMADALGVGLDVLIAVKQALDPHGILNPGKLGLPSPFGPVPWPDVEATVGR